MMKGHSYKRLASKTKRIIRLGWMLLATCLAFACSASAESRIPSFSAFAGIPGEQCVLSENADTITLQCITDRERIEQYRLLLSDYGFLTGGSWTLPAGEGYQAGALNAYFIPGASDIAFFHMSIPQGPEVPCHLFIQHFDLADGTSAVSLTWSRGLLVDQPGSPLPSETPETPEPEHGRWVTEIRESPCFVCDMKGICKMCNGSGEVEDHMTMIFTKEKTMKMCEVCGGTGDCPNEYCEDGTMKVPYQVWVSD